MFELTELDRAALTAALGAEPLNAKVGGISKDAKAHLKANPKATPGKARKQAKADARQSCMGGGQHAVHWSSTALYQ
jgi:hypothetical protein